MAERSVELRDAERRIGRHVQRDRGGIQRLNVATTVDQPLLDVASDSGETFPVDNPATGETIANVPRMGAAETRRAIARAEEALPAWRSMLAKDRARILRRWADLMLENEDGLARLLTAEQGKPLAESRLEIAYAASFY